MKRITQGNINTPQLFNSKFNHSFALDDMERLEKLVKYFKGGTYVDVGVLDSIMPVILSERFPKSEIYALDFSDEVIDFLKPKFPKVKYQVSDLREGLPFDYNSVDYIVAGELIEHLEDPIGFIEHCLSKIKKGGVLALSTPHKESQHREVGGEQHLWSFDENDFKRFDAEIEILDKTLLIWIKK